MAMRRAWLGLWLLLVLVWSAPARADKVADAEALFDAARDLAKSGNYQEACPKFEASHELDEQLGTLINIADCYEHTGQIATAWARWEAAREWAKRKGDDRLDMTTKGVERVAPRLPKLVVRVTNPVDDLRIVRGDIDLAAPMYGVALPVDPGQVRVRVLRGEQLLEERTVAAVEAQTAELQLDLAAIAAAHPVEESASDQPTSSGPDEPYDPTHRNIGLIVGAVGAAAVLTAVGLEIAALVKKGQADSPDSCVNQFCSPEGLDAADSAATFAKVGQWVGIGGLAVLAVGATIFFTAPDDTSDSTDESVAAEAVNLVPWLGPGGAGLVVGGRF